MTCSSWRALHALGLDGHGALAVLLGHFHFAQAVLVADLDQLLCFDAGVLGQLALFFLHLGGLGFLAGTDGLDLALLACFGFGLLAFQRQQRFTCLHILLGDGELFVLFQLVGHHVLRGGQLGDLADALRVENVELVQQRLRRLLQVVDRHVFQHVAIEVVADHRDDLVAEFLALLEQFGEVELLANRLQRFGELGVEQLIDGVLVRRTVGTDGLGHAQHVGLGLVDPQVEGHGDVGTHVVAADQALLAAAIDLQGDQADPHQLGAVQHRDDQCASEMHLGRGAHVVDDQGHTLVDLAVEGLEQAGQAEQADQQDHHADQEGGHGCQCHQ
ncbi:hypothetical protein [Stenotrophomonas maltophilia]|uniref:hypothetical protein n=1 Tax=Stenotrophomonas maltophilia TaxID=40324 RepID=UPI00215576CF|nr:hypothetical protein [Stenotrophomonas maltophilia]